jgi:hypothetical protein
MRVDADGCADGLSREPSRQLRVQMRKHFYLLLLLLILAACTSSVPKYTKNLTSDSSGATTIRLESVTDMSASAMRGALFTEAARATIDAGNLYLRVDEITEDSSIAVKEKTDPNPDPVTRSRSSSVGLSRHRSGVIRFRSSREKPPGENVYDASDLLDRIKRGSVPG